jgi:phage FluMu protein Com
MPDFDIKWLAAVERNASLQKKCPNGSLRPG